MLCMIFGQLACRESLRDLVLTINVHKNKIYHLGFGKIVTRSTLADANESRPWQIYHDFAYYLVEHARKICSDRKADEFSFSNPIYAVDSSTVDLCLNLFWWATFKTTKSATHTVGCAHKYCSFCRSIRFEPSFLAHISVIPLHQIKNYGGN